MLYGFNDPLVREKTLTGVNKDFLFFIIMISKKCGLCKILRHKICWMNFSHNLNIFLKFILTKAMQSFIWVNRRMMDLNSKFHLVNWAFTHKWWLGQQLSKSSRHLPPKKHVYPSFLVQLYHRNKYSYYCKHWTLF